ncbi:NfeD family protein [Sulfobacillus harzensis]|uniref:NfeD-like C-terminal domain-containing protein n=1 Tax=Sulfobacillus harzensis TaxID=2729629 RepID=A0A7Y0Q165_9FIRM|nr:NfeD family protein [Sulfobacillus harzensis]NMP21783.1 hypothetical protein [Sulfobacillus harzensis]
MSYRPSIDRLTGQSGTVIDTVPGERRGTGVVRVSGELWTAETDWPEALLPQTPVLVVGRSGLRLSVLPERGGSNEAN